MLKYTLFHPYKQASLVTSQFFVKNDVDGLFLFG